MRHKRKILAVTVHTVSLNYKLGLFIAYHAEYGYCHTSTEGEQILLEILLKRIHPPSRILNRPRNLLLRTGSINPKSC
jgi:hypothetical protein